MSSDATLRRKVVPKVMRGSPTKEEVVVRTPTKGSMAREVVLRAPGKYLSQTGYGFGRCTKQPRNRVRCGPLAKRKGHATCYVRFWHVDRVTASQHQAAIPESRGTSLGERKECHRGRRWVKTRRSVVCRISTSTVEISGFHVFPRGVSCFPSSKTIKDSTCRI